MTNYKPSPTYYHVTWNQGSPTDYTDLTGTQAGGLDSVSPIKYNEKVSITGNASSPTTTAGDTLLINGYTILFGSSSLADILTTINMSTVLTNVIAHNAVSSNYVTLTNADGYEGLIIELAEGNGALAKLGFTAGSYNALLNGVGGAFTNFTNGDVVTINGVNITMTTGGGLNVAGAVATINSFTSLTGVVAIAAAGTVQLSSVNGQPFVTAGSAASKLGFPAGVYAGSPGTLDQSTSKTQANLRWQQVVNQLEVFSTPFMLADQLGTGNYSGDDELTTFSFTVGYEHPDQIFTVALASEPDAGTVLTGTAAIKRAVARGLTASYTGNTNLFDPTVEVRNGCAIRPNPVRTVRLTADGFDTVANIATVEGNITVSMISLD